MTAAHLSLVYNTNLRFKNKIENTLIINLANKLFKRNWRDTSDIIRLILLGNQFKNKKRYIQSGTNEPSSLKSLYGLIESISKANHT